MVRGGEEREVHGEASTGRVIGFEGASHGFGEATREGEPEPDAGRPVPIAGALEGQKGSIAFVGREPWTVVPTIFRLLNKISGSPYDERAATAAKARIIRFFTEHLAIAPRG